MKLIVCLGNPGKEYEYTRHNAGFLCFDEIKNLFEKKFTISLGLSKKRKNYEAEVFQKAVKNIDDHIVLLKPLSYMNRSGEAVRDFLKTTPYPLISVKDVWVIHDDIALPLGTLRIDSNKSAGGHNGIQNIIDHMKTKEFTRFRIGIAAQSVSTTPLETYVLKKFPRSELSIIKNMACVTAEAIHDAIDHGIPFSQQKVNRHVFFKCI